MGAFDSAILVLQLVIIAIAGVIAAATRTRQEYNEYHGKLEEFPNPRSAWPFSGSMRESPSKGRPKSRILMSTPCRAV